MWSENCGCTKHMTLHNNRGGKKWKKTKDGITLIALIITIIVMLILVGVTINVAMQGGIFEKAKTASYNTAFEAEKESLINYMLRKV